MLSRAQSVEGFNVSKGLKRANRVSENIVLRLSVGTVKRYLLVLQTSILGV